MNRLYLVWQHVSLRHLADNTHEVLAHIPQPSQSIRFWHFAEDENVFNGRNVYSELSENRYHFYQLTGETPETMIDLQNLIVLHDTREHMIPARNWVLLFVIWLRVYPTYNLLSNVFDVSVTVVGTEITSLLPVFCEKLDHFLVWPTEEDWRSMLGVWTKLPMAVGAIYCSSHRIYRPEVEPQKLYYSRHRHFHCLHTQVVCDSYGTIRYTESGLMYAGHLNDAQQFGLMQQLRMGDYRYHELRPLISYFPCHWVVPVDFPNTCPMKIVRIFYRIIARYGRDIYTLTQYFPIYSGAISQHMI